MKNVLNTYLSGCSPYISQLLYDINNRVLTLECVNNVEEFLPKKRILFEGVISYSESTEDVDYDDELIDGVVSMFWNSEENEFILLTDKKEIIVKLEKEPQIENIKHNKAH